MTTTTTGAPAGPAPTAEQIRQAHAEKLDAIARYRRVTNYLAAAEIYLKENVLLEEPLRPEHIKDRLLGHWGTSPGINLIYAHLNALTMRHDIDIFLVTGPGHGARANLASVWWGGSVDGLCPELRRYKAGRGTVVRRCSCAGGFRSHLYPGVPGTIHEGGELGYALATAFGAAMDNPDLVVACIVGDGEAETGPTATAWHSYKFLDPAESGAVLPVVHLNRYKISNPTIYGTMSDEELFSLFTGYGYQVQFVEGEDLDAALYGALDWAYQEIRRIQQAARSGRPIAQPRWPVILLRSLKGWTCPKEMDGEPLEGSYRSHQVPIPDPKTNPEHLHLLEGWLRSYHVEELFDEQGHPKPEILEQCPKGDRRMGSNPHTYGGRIRKDLDLPGLLEFDVPVEQTASGKQSPAALPRGVNDVSNVAHVARYLKAVIERNPHTFRIFSPDELESNKLGAVLEATRRNYQWPIPPHNEKISSNDGRVIEILSEHTIQAWLQGYLLTGRHGLFPSYEAFLNIIISMMDQYAKFLKMSIEIPWRLPVASLNYLETSTLWRLVYSDFSHQSPDSIPARFTKNSHVARIYLPPDANCLISTVDHCLRSKEYVNLIIANKPPMPQWLSMPDAIAHCRAGASVWQWASIDDGVNPDVVLVGIGDNPTLEVMAAAHILRNERPELRVRVVNVTDLFVLEKETAHPHGLDDEMFEALFTPDAPVIVNFHGYPSAVKQLIFGRNHVRRFYINGYQEEGTTTTPFDMNVRNGTDRYHLITQAIRLASTRNPRVAARASERVHHYEYVLVAFRRYIQENGVDPEEISNWQWS